MGRVPLRVVLIGIALVSAGVPSPAAADRLLVPGGAAALRRVTAIPDHVPDSMLLSEAARAWFGVRDPVPSDARHAADLLAYLTTSKEPLQPGPWLPLSTGTWMRLLEVKAPADIAAALVRSRNAMLLYRGLTGVDDRTLAWLDAQPDLLTDLLTHAAPAFATAGPWLSITPQGIAVPGGADATDQWREIVGASPSDPPRFVKAILEKDNSRIAWMLSALAALDPARAKFVVGDRGRNLPSLAAHFVKLAPEWSMVARAFSRPSFDPSIALMLLNPAADGSFAGSEEFWRAVFTAEEGRPTAGRPLTAAGIVDVLFENPLQARARWEVFSLGQRMLRTAPANQQTAAALTAALRYPALALALERMGTLTPDMLRRLADGAGRITRFDSDGHRGDLALWQAALVTVERAAINGGVSAAEAAPLLSSLADLPLQLPRRELTGWFMDVWLGRLLSRPGAPSDAEQALLRTMAGDLRGTGGPDAPRFSWEELDYTLATEHHMFLRMQEARGAQAGPTLTDVRTAWSGPPQDLALLCTRLEEMNDEPAILAAAKRVAAALSKKDAGRLDRDRRDLADALIGRVLLPIAYAPQHAASDAPGLGGDVALRHEIMMAEGPDARRRRPWQLAMQVAFEGKPWHLAGSLLTLDIPLSGWYLRANGEAPMGTPIIEEPDVYSLALTAVLGSTEDIERLTATLGAIDTGRSRVADSPDLTSSDALLASHGIDPWRRRALQIDATSPSDVAGRLTPSEAWRIGTDGAVPIIPGIPFDGCPCLSTIPFTPMIAEGRPSNGMVGALVPGLALRIASFLKARGLPLALYRPLAGGAAFDVIHSADAVRTDDVNALDVAAARLTDARLEEHVLALIADGTLATPSTQAVP